MQAIDSSLAADLSIEGGGWLWGTAQQQLVRFGVQVVHVLADEREGCVVCWVDSIQSLPCTQGKGLLDPVVLQVRSCGNTCMGIWGPVLCPTCMP